MRNHKTVRGTPLGGQEKIKIKVIAVHDFLVQLLLPTLNLLFSQFSEAGKQDLSIPGLQWRLTVM